MRTYVVCYCVFFYMGITTSLHAMSTPDITMAATPEESRGDKFKFALAWSKGRRDSLNSSTLHLPSGNRQEGGILSHSPSASSLLGMKGENLETHSLDDIVEKLHHESNIYVQADYLTYLYSSQ